MLYQSELFYTDMLKGRIQMQRLQYFEEDGATMNYPDYIPKRKPVTGRLATVEGVDAHRAMDAMELDSGAFPSAPMGIGIERRVYGWRHGSVYWTDWRQAKIQRSTLEGSETMTVMDSKDGLENPRSLYVYSAYEGISPGTIVFVSDWKGMPDPYNHLEDANKRPAKNPTAREHAVDLVNKPKRDVLTCAPDAVAYTSTYLGNPAYPELCQRQIDYAGKEGCAGERYAWGIGSPYWKCRVQQTFVAFQRLPQLLPQEPATTNDPVNSVGPVATEPDDVFSRQYPAKKGMLYRLESVEVLQSVASMVTGISINGGASLACNPALTGDGADDCQWVRCSLQKLQFYTESDQIDVTISHTVGKVATPSSAGTGSHSFDAYARSNAIAAAWQCQCDESNWNCGRRTAPTHKPYQSGTSNIPLHYTDIHGMPDGYQVGGTPVKMAVRVTLIEVNGDFRGTYAAPDGAISLAYTGVYANIATAQDFSTIGFTEVQAHHTDESKSYWKFSKGTLQHFQITLDAYPGRVGTLITYPSYNDGSQSSYIAWGDANPAMSMGNGFTWTKQAPMQFACRPGFCRSLGTMGGGVLEDLNQNQLGLYGISMNNQNAQDFCQMQCAATKDCAGYTVDSSCVFFKEGTCDVINGPHEIEQYDEEAWWGGSRATCTKTVNSFDRLAIEPSPMRGRTDSRWRAGFLDLSTVSKYASGVVRSDTIWYTPYMSNTMGMYDTSSLDFTALDLSREIGGQAYEFMKIGTQKDPKEASSAYAVGAAFSVVPGGPSLKCSELKKEQDGTPIDATYMPIASAEYCTKAAMAIGVLPSNGRGAREISSVGSPSGCYYDWYWDDLLFNVAEQPEVGWNYYSPLHEPICEKVCLDLSGSWKMPVCHTDSTSQVGQYDCAEAGTTTAEGNRGVYWAPAVFEQDGCTGTMTVPKVAFGLQVNDVAVKYTVTGTEIHLDDRSDSISAYTASSTPGANAALLGYIVQEPTDAAYYNYQGDAPYTMTNMNSYCNQNSNFKSSLFTGDFAQPARCANVVANSLTCGDTTGFTKTFELAFDTATSQWECSCMKTDGMTGLQYLCNPTATATVDRDYKTSIYAVKACSSLADEATCPGYCVWTGTQCKKCNDYTNSGQSACPTVCLEHG
jgi:hypothetical protein